MPFQRPLYALASALAAAGAVLTAAGCSSGVAPLGPDPAPVNLPAPHPLRSQIIMQVMRGRPPTPAGRCPAGTFALFGLALVPRAVAAPPRLQRSHAGQGGTPAPPAPPPGPGAPPPPPPAGAACFLPAGKPLTITSAAVSSVVTYPPPPGTPKGPVTYGFLVGLPAADSAAATAVFNQAYRLGADVGLSVAGKLWQARQADRTTSVQGAQILLLSKTQAVQLHRLLVPSG
jgi:hypothetical protein